MKGLMTEKKESTEEGFLKRFPGYRNNIKTIIRAAKDDRLAIMVCQDKVTKQELAVVCAVSNDKEQNDLVFVPLAKMFAGNPYEELNPPNPEGGYFDETDG